MVALVPAVPLLQAAGGKGAGSASVADGAIACRTRGTAPPRCAFRAMAIASICSPVPSARAPWHCGCAMAYMQLQMHIKVGDHWHNHWGFRMFTRYALTGLRGCCGPADVPFVRRRAHRKPGASTYYIFFMRCEENERARLELCAACNPSDIY